jgi:glutaminyl-peptide cyclotransferase
MAKRRGKSNRRGGRQPTPARARRRSRLWVGAGLIGAGAAIAAAGLLSRDATETGSEAGANDLAPASSGAAPVERLRARVIRRYPHQPDAFTQGLVWHDGLLYESTGMEGHSSLRAVELETGEVLRRRDDAPDLFGEGLALAGDLLYQITWQNGRALVFRRDDFAPVREFSYEGEGWGLCADGASLVMSDGSDQLVFRDPATFAARRAVRASLEGRPVTQLNELECVDGAVWANVWQTDAIVRIDPRDGRVTAVVDASGLLTADERQAADVLNGIAWMPESGHFLVTGKYWPWLFEVVFDPSGATSP